jgi:hypothetical protein
VGRGGAAGADPRGGGEADGVIEPQRRRAKIIVRTPEELRTEIAEVEARIGDCTFEYCPHHWDDYRHLQELRWLAGGLP